ncbi:MAG: glycerate kinase [Terrimonas sp.]|nr:glycerate kinase [Terrimonas sp.]
MHILLAPNAFKNALAAPLAAAALQKGLLASHLKCTLQCFPVGDGGDGTAALIIRHTGGEFISRSVLDPFGREIDARLGITDGGKTAVIEMADASGLRLLQPDQYDPLMASSYGTGQLILGALDRGVQKIILCIGGSATVDGATGITRALGVRFLNSEGAELKKIPADLPDLARIDLSQMDNRIFRTELIILCDVDNTLLGPQGAAMVFGPQKGANAEDCLRLEAGLSRLRDVILAATGSDIAIIPHGGAAGGVAAGLAGMMKARLLNGIEAFLEITGFESALTPASLVITGEGSIDAQTLQGKGPFGVAKRAKEKGIPVIGVAGKIPLEADPGLQAYFDVLIPINHRLTDLQEAILDTELNLEWTARMIGDLLALKCAG